MKESHRGLSVAQNGCGFCVLLGRGPPNWQVPSSTLISRADSKDFNAAELGAA